MGSQEQPHDQEKSASERLTESLEARATGQSESGGTMEPTQKKEIKSSINKYILVGGVLVAIFIFGGIYQAFFVPEAAKPIVTGIERFLTITVHENTWAFDPEFIEADQGDKIILTVINKDEYDHGFAVDAFGISQRMPAKSTIRIEFVVTKAGDFPYYCSVSCGSGVVDGEDRGHFDQIGRIHVRSIVSETVDYGAPTTEELKEQARHAAMVDEARRYLKEEFNLDVSKDRIRIDEENVEWLSQEVSLDILIDVDYQALSSKKIIPRIWIFINTETGEVIDTFSDK